MCGRYTLTTPAAKIADYYELDTVPTSLLKELLIPYRRKLITYPVSRDVNNPRNNNERLIEPVTGKSEGP